jgi:hypothetical protein
LQDGGYFENDSLGASFSMNLKNPFELEDDDEMEILFPYNKKKLKDGLHRLKG